MPENVKVYIGLAVFVVFVAMPVWWQVLGANEPKGFNVFGLAGPSRLVIDVCTGGPDWG